MNLNTIKVLTKRSSKVEDVFKKNGRADLYKLEEEIKWIKGEQEEPHHSAPLQQVEAFLEKVKENAKRVVMIVHKSYVLESEGSSKVLIWSNKLCERKLSNHPDYKMCSDALFASQPSAFSVGTGFFISNQMIATAAHVLISAGYDIREFRFIRGVIKCNDDDYKKSIIVDKSQVFRPTHTAPKLSYKRYKYYPDGEDWALVSVKPAYPDFLPSDLKPLGEIKSTSIEEGAKIYAIGHGLGLPMKISYYGKVKRINSDSSFETELTLLGGNSGSPVFYSKDHTLAGIYVRGLKKIVKNKKEKCLIIQDISKNNKGDGWNGQECQIIQPVIEAFNKLKPKKND